MWPPAEFFIHTLLSVGVPWIARWPSWPASLSHSLGVDHIWNLPVLRSSFAMVLWYITRTHGLPSRAISRSRVPSGQPGLRAWIGYGVTAPLFGSILLRYLWPKSEYQTSPSRSRTTSR